MCIRDSYYAALIYYICSTTFLRFTLVDRIELCLLIDFTGKYLVQRKKYRHQDEIKNNNHIKLFY